MASKVHTVNADDDVTTALRQMRTNQIGRLPVIDAKGKLKGIVSMHNLLNQATGNGKKIDLGTSSSSGETLFKTMQAITDRYSNGKAQRVR